MHVVRMNVREIKTNEKIVASRLNPGASDAGERVRKSEITVESHLIDVSCAPSLHDGEINDRRTAARS